MSALLTKDQSARQSPHTLIPNPHFASHQQRRERERRERQERGNSKGKRHYMPRYVEPEQMTPFAIVLTDFMWNKRPANRPPINVPQLAVRLKVPRQSVANWIYRGQVPSFEAILAVLAQLDIPLRTLYDAYKDSGLTVPRWDVSDTQKPQLTGMTVATRTKKQTAIPVDEINDQINAAATPPEAEPRPAIEPPSEWERIVAQTTEALRGVGANQATIDAAIEHLRAQQQPINPRELTLAAEQTADNEDEEDEHQPPDRASKRQQAHKAPTTQR
jgi:Bacteriophage CI repressor helix-turn-helix domain